MSRPLRIEFAGAVYHVTSRGDRREPIFRDEEDRLCFLGLLGTALDRFDGEVLSHCLMGNHYHLVLHTRQPNLSRLMRHLNGVYTQAFNRRHALAGHLLQGRFKAILVDRDPYLLALCRYVERNPVAAGLVARPEDWAWSSYRAHIGAALAPAWLDCAGLYGYLLGRPVVSARDRTWAQGRYAALVDSAKDEDTSFWQTALRSQVFLGDEDFVERMQALAAPALRSDREVPRAHRQTRIDWTRCLQQCQGDRDRAIALAYRAGGHTMSAIGGFTDLSVSQIGRIVQREGKGKT